MKVETGWAYIFIPRIFVPAATVMGYFWLPLAVPGCHEELQTILGCVRRLWHIAYIHECFLISIELLKGFNKFTFIQSAILGSNLSGDVLPPTLSSPLMDIYTTRQFFSYPYLPVRYCAIHHLWPRPCLTGRLLRSIYSSQHGPWRQPAIKSLPAATVTYNRPGWICIIYNFTQMLLVSF